MMTPTLIHHTDLATVPDKRSWDGECWVEEPRFYCWLCGTVLS